MASAVLIEHALSRTSLRNPTHDATSVQRALQRACIPRDSWKDWNSIRHPVPVWSQSRIEEIDPTTRIVHSGFWNWLPIDLRSKLRIPDDLIAGRSTDSSIMRNYRELLRSQGISGIPTIVELCSGFGGWALAWRGVSSFSHSNNKF